MLPNMPRYVILRHDWPFPHFDLLLEVGPTLMAWRLHDEPLPGVWVSAERNADHRLFYLDYEGPVSGDRGSVTRYLSGVYEGDVGGDEWVTSVGELRDGRFLFTG